MFSRRDQHEGRFHGLLCLGGKVMAGNAGGLVLGLSKRLDGRNSLKNMVINRQRVKYIDIFILTLPHNCDPIAHGHRR